MRGDETRRRLREAALDLFEKHGYDAVSTTQIAAAAGVSDRTFFRHFSSKVQSLFGEADGRAEFFVATLHAQPAELGPLEALLQTIVQEEREYPSTVDDLRRGRVVRETPSLANEVRAFEGVVEGYFRDWLAARYDRAPDDFEVAVVAATLVASRRTVVDAWLEADGKQPISELAERALETIDVHLGGP